MRSPDNAAKVQGLATVYDQLWPILSNLKERPMREMLEDFVRSTNRRYLEGDEHAERSEQKK